MPNLHSSSQYNKTGFKSLPETFDVDFINHINHGLFDDQLEPIAWFRELHTTFDGSIGSGEVSRHINHAIKGTEFEGKYSF